MDNSIFIKQGLYLQGLAVYETDIPYIQNILYTMKQAQNSLHTFPHLNMEVPITIVDKGLIR